MTHGKKTCKILKEIRQQIADKNDIEYVTSECHFQGECKGTCPKCEEELQYLENELSKRRQLGKAVAVAGISLGLASTFTDCNTLKQNAIQQENMSISEERTLKRKIKLSDNVDTIIKKPVAYTSVHRLTQARGTATIKGKLVEEDSKTPIAFATIRLIQNGALIIGAIVNERGLFTLDSVPAGKYDLQISCIGYNKYERKDVEIEDNRLNDIGEIQMKSLPEFINGIIIVPQNEENIQE